jgi:hypothetical protein
MSPFDFNFKGKVVVARAEAAVALAQIQLEHGSTWAAARGFASQARDLRRRGLSPDLERRAWLGVLVAGAGEGSSCPGLEEAVWALREIPADELRGQVGPYHKYRDTLRRLLIEGAAPMAQTFGALVSQWYPGDPRPAYGTARALEAALPGRAAGQREVLARRALEWYDRTLTIAVQAGVSRQWRVVVGIRKAGVLLRYLRGSDPDAARRALGEVECVERGTVGGLAAPYRLVVAHAWLHSSNSIVRLRALDLLDELASRGHREDVAAVLEDYVSCLDWTYYATEHDRAKAIAIQTGVSPGALRQLELLADLHDALGRDSHATVEHLGRLRDAGKTAVHDVYFTVAIAIAGSSEVSAVSLAGSPPPDDDEVARLHASWMSGSVDAVGVALAALWLHRNPDPGHAHSLLVAASHPSLRTPQGQVCLTLALPVLLRHWRQWSSIHGEVVRAVERYLRYTRPPSFGFGVLALALADLGEWELAGRAALRAHAQGEPADCGLRERLAAHAMSRGEPESATRWLLPALAS